MAPRGTSSGDSTFVAAGPVFPRKYRTAQGLVTPPVSSPTSMDGFAPIESSVNNERHDHHGEDGGVFMDRGVNAAAFERALGGSATGKKMGAYTAPTLPYGNLYCERSSSSYFDENCENSTSSKHSAVGSSTTTGGKSSSGEMVVASSSSKGGSSSASAAAKSAKRSSVPSSPSYAKSAEKGCAEAPCVFEKSEAAGEGPQSKSSKESSARRTGYSHLYDLQNLRTLDEYGYEFNPAQHGILEHMRHERQWRPSQGAPDPDESSPSGSEATPSGSSPSDSDNETGPDTTGPVCVPVDTKAISRGSCGHERGECKPCAFFHRPEGCVKGANCERCHLCPEGEIKRRKLLKKECRKAEALRVAQKMLSKTTKTNWSANSRGTNPTDNAHAQHYQQQRAHSQHAQHAQQLAQQHQVAQQAAVAAAHQQHQQYAAEHELHMAQRGLHAAQQDLEAATYAHYCATAYHQYGAPVAAPHGAPAGNFYTAAQGPLPPPLQGPLVAPGYHHGAPLPLGGGHAAGVGAPTIPPMPSYEQSNYENHHHYEQQQQQMEELWAAAAAVPGHHPSARSSSANNKRSTSSGQLRSSTYNNNFPVQSRSSEFLRAGYNRGCSKSTFGSSTYHGDQPSGKHRPYTCPADLAEFERATSKQLRKKQKHKTFPNTEEPAAMSPPPYEEEAYVRHRTYSGGFIPEKPIIPDEEDSTTVRVPTSDIKEETITTSNDGTTSSNATKKGDEEQNDFKSPPGSVIAGAVKDADTELSVKTCKSEDENTVVGPDDVFGDATPIPTIASNTSSSKKTTKELQKRSSTASTTISCATPSSSSAKRMPEEPDQAPRTAEEGKDDLPEPTVKLATEKTVKDAADVTISIDLKSLNALIQRSSGGMKNLVLKPSKASGSDSDDKVVLGIEDAAGAEE